MKFGIKQVWSALFTLSCLVMLWTLATFTVKLILYNRMDKTTAAEITHWGVMQVEEDLNFVVADFRCFPLAGEEVVSQYVFERQKYRSYEGAELAIEAMKGRKWNAYWRGNATSPIVSLELLFPYKQLINFLIALGVTLYFYWMKQVLYGRANLAKTQS